MPDLWAGIDAGKTHHHCVVVDADGQRRLSRKVANDENELLQLMGDVAELGGEVAWAIDLNSGGAALLIALLVNHGQQLHYIPGRTVHHASGSYRGEGKTDCGHDLCGVLSVAGPEDRSAACLVGDTSAAGSAPLRVPGRARCGLIGA